MLSLELCTMDGSNAARMPQGKTTYKVMFCANRNNASSGLLPFVENASRSF